MRPSNLAARSVQGNVQLPTVILVSLAATMSAGLSPLGTALRNNIASKSAPTSNVDRLSGRAQPPTLPTVGTQTEAASIFVAAARLVDHVTDLRAYMRKFPGAEPIHHQLADNQLASLFRRNQQDFRPWLSELASRSFQPHHNNSAAHNARMMKSNQLMRHHLPQLSDQVFNGRFADASGHPLSEVMNPAFGPTILERIADVSESIRTRTDSLASRPGATQYFEDIADVDPLSSWLMSERARHAANGQRYHSEAPAWFDPSRFDSPNLGALDVAHDELARQLAPIFEYSYGQFDHAADSFQGEVRVRVRRVDDGSGPKGWVELETTATPRIEVSPDGKQVRPSQSADQVAQQQTQTSPIQQTPVGKQPHGPDEIALVAERAQYAIQQILGSMNEPVRYGVRNSRGDGIHTVSQGTAYGRGTPLQGMSAGRAQATLQGNFQSWPSSHSGASGRSVLDPETRIFAGTREPGTTVHEGTIFGPLSERYVRGNNLSDGYIYKPWDYVEAALSRPEGFEIVIQPGRAPSIELPTRKLAD